ncbi:MAG TPA: ABC transporter ATP-binding protein, partial [Candidatus Saccharimonadales bacterium]|nr:ABC transporter ATP-binding protein [Candidatus Saccharimonadales bacterium]
MKPTISAEALAVTKSNKPILNNLDFEIKQGSLNGLIGPSGAGKTTLIRAIVGIQRLSSGRLTVLGAAAGEPKLRSKIGYVTQSPSVYADLTVRQNIEYFAKLLRAPKSDVDKVIDQVHLRPQADQVVSSLSGGQHARVSLAVALLGNPEILVLDEPTVGLDPLLRQDLWQLFK